MVKMTRQKDVQGGNMVGNMTYVCYRTRGDPMKGLTRVPL